MVPLSCLDSLIKTVLTIGEAAYSSCPFAPDKSFLVAFPFAADKSLAQTTGKAPWISQSPSLDD